MRPEVMTVSEDRKRVGSDGGIIQWADEATGREPFERWTPDAGGLVDGEPIATKVNPFERMICPECRVSVRTAAAIGRTDWHADGCSRRGERP